MGWDPSGFHLGDDRVERRLVPVALEFLGVRVGGRRGEEVCRRPERERDPEFVSAAWGQAPESAWPPGPVLFSLSSLHEGRNLPMPKYVMLTTLTDQGSRLFALIRSACAR